MFTQRIDGDVNLRALGPLSTHCGLRRFLDSRLMRRQTAFSLLALMSLTSGCTKAGGANDTLALDIERQVTAAHPEVRLDRFARFYAREQGGSVRAIYLFANEGYEPIVGKAGTSSWTPRDKLPVVYDGGCSVLNIRYDVAHKKLLEIQCNGDA